MKEPKNEPKYVPKGDQRRFLAVGPRPADVLFAALLILPGVMGVKPRWLLWVVPLMAGLFLLWWWAARRKQKQFAAMDAAEKYRGVDPGLIEEAEKAASTEEKKTRRMMLCLRLGVMVVLVAVGAVLYLHGSPGGDSGYTLRICNRTDAPIEGVTMYILHGDLENGGTMIGYRSYKNYRYMQAHPVAVGQTMEVEMEEFPETGYQFPAETTLSVYLPTASDQARGRFVGNLCFTAEQGGVVDCELSGNQEAGYQITLK